MPHPFRAHSAARPVHRPSVRRARAHVPTIAALAVLLAGAACVDSGRLAPDEDAAPPRQVELSPYVITCQAELRNGGFACASGEGGSPAEFQATLRANARVVTPEVAPSTARTDQDHIIIGGQGTFVQLTPSNATFDAGTRVFTVDVTLQNLIPQPLGKGFNPFVGDFTGTDTRVFFHTGPTNGVEPTNALTGNFTSTDQWYFRYASAENNLETSNGWLDPEETSRPVTWEFDVPEEVESFSFELLVEGVVLSPNGFVLITPGPAAGVEVEQSLQLGGTVVDAWGVPIDGASVDSWSSDDAAIATVSSTGLVTASTLNETVRIEATSGDVPDPGEVRVKVYEVLSTRSPIQISDTQDGELNYMLTMPSAAASLLVFGTDAGTNPDGGNGIILYARHGSVPISSMGTAQEGFWYDCRSNQNLSGANLEVCKFPDAAAGEWFATVRASSDYVDALVGADFAISDPGFDIELDFRGSLAEADETEKQVWRDAAARWEQVVGDNFEPFSYFEYPYSIMCKFDGPADKMRVIDDLLIFVEVDNLTSAIGSGGPCTAPVTMRSSGLPSMGQVTFNTDDYTTFDDVSREMVIRHEYGHVLGIGSLWEDFGVVSGLETSDPVYTGTHGKQAYVDVGGPSGDDVPVENTGGTGTFGGHWRESVFETELMDGFLNDPDMDGVFEASENVLSKVSARSLVDLTYTVNADSWDEYSLPSSTSGAMRGNVLSLGNDVRIYYVDEEGVTRERTPGIPHPR